MIITITQVIQEFTKNGAEYLKVKGTTADGKEITKSVFDNLEESWELLQEGATLDFKLEKKGQFWNVAGISEIGEPASPQKRNTTPSRVEYPDGINDGRLDGDKPKLEIAPQEKGMFWKELGENFRAGLINKDDNDVGTYLWGVYTNQMFSSLGITIPVKKEVQSALVEEAKKLGAVPAKITKPQWATIQKIMKEDKLDRIQADACAQQTIGKGLDKPAELLYDEAEKLIAALAEWKKEL